MERVFLFAFDVGSANGIALIGAVGTALGALVALVFSVLKWRQDAHSITISDRQGAAEIRDSLISAQSRELERKDAEIARLVERRDHEIQKLLDADKSPLLKEKDEEIRRLAHRCDQLIAANEKLLAIFTSEKEDHVQHED